jgi:ribosome biogenesis GTPase A
MLIQPGQTTTVDRVSMAYEARTKTAVTMFHGTIPLRPTMQLYLIPDVASKLILLNAVAKSQDSSPVPEEPSHAVGNQIKTEINRSPTASIDFRAASGIMSKGPEAIKNEKNEVHTQHLFENESSSQSYNSPYPMDEGMVTNTSSLDSPSEQLLRDMTGSPGVEDNNDDDPFATPLGISRSFNPMPPTDPVPSAALLGFSEPRFGSPSMGSQSNSPSSFPTRSAFFPVSSNLSRNPLAAPVPPSPTSTVFKPYVGPPYVGPSTHGYGPSKVLPKRKSAKPQHFHSHPLQSVYHSPSSGSSISHTKSNLHPTMHDAHGFQTPRSGLSGQAALAADDLPPHSTNLLQYSKPVSSLAQSLQVPGSSKSTSSPTSKPVPPVPHDNRLQGFMTKATPEELEAEIEKGMTLSDQLKTKLSKQAAQSADARQWVQQIDELKKQNVAQRTIIGVVGNTGAGKSSVINALLDEERLVPTNCMRACTAVVTEISYNDDNDEESKYCAQIEFIKPEEWEKELKMIYSEMLDSNGNVSRESANDETEAGVAYAKIKAVYPKMTKEELAQSTIERLMKDETVNAVLGKSINVKESRPAQFYKRLQHYVDSKEKSQALKKKDREEAKAAKEAGISKEKGRQAPREMEYWPLIKVVKIQTKAEALSTGAVIVDLPGVHDANAARASIAEGYMKQCTGLWIVAPINRAVDDKAAKSLLDESFKRQLKYDGTYSRVTFICSKTDDISITEASDSLNLQDEMAVSWDEVDKIEAKQITLKEQTTELKDSKAAFGDILNESDDLLEIWDSLKDDVEGGRTVYAPADKTSRKRKQADKKKSRKSINSGRRDSDGDEDDDSTSDVDDSASEDEGDSTDKGEPLTEDVVDAKIEELKAQKKQARRQRAEFDVQIKDINKELENLRGKKDELEAGMSAICIAGRNTYSKSAIQMDFASGIKELDQENAAEEDEENFDPETDIRDYDEVARSLPVFCVSSRAYQKLLGRLQRDNDVPGFTTTEETEIP